MHPAVAGAEHLHKLGFELLPIVVAPKEQGLDGCGEIRFGRVELLQCLAGGAAVKLVGLFGDGQSAAEAGEQRLTEGQFTAERVDG